MAVDLKPVFRALRAAQAAGDVGRVSLMEDKIAREATPLLWYILDRREFPQPDDPDDREDVANSAFLDAIRAFDPDRGPTFATFLIEVLKNAYRDAFRASQRCTPVKRLEDTPLTPGPDWAEVTTGCTPDEQALLTLRFIEGMSYQEIGEALGIDRETAADRIKAVLAKCRRRIG